MKLKIILTLSLFLLLSNVMVFANAFSNEVLSIEGQINDVRDKEIIVEGKGVYPEIRLNVSNNTYIYDSKNNFLISGYIFTVGENITVYHGPTMSKSLPPLTNAFAVIFNNAEKVPQYIRGSVVERTSDHIKILSVNKELIFTINKSIYSDLDKITDNSEMLVWYDIVALSMPGQTAPYKLVLLNNTADMICSKQAGVLAVNNKEIQIILQDNNILVPLRETAEILGLSVSWNAYDRSVTLTGNDVFKINIDSNYYLKNNSSTTLEQKAVIVNAKTYVPLDFFSNVMNKSVMLNNNSI